MTNSQYDDLMDDLNSDPEFDKILAEMLPNSGENIIPVTSASSAVARSHTAAQSPMYSRAIISGMLAFKYFLNQLLLTKMHKLLKNYNIIQLLVFKETNIRINWAASSEFGTYHLCVQRRFKRACASAQSRQNLRCLLIQVVSQAETSNRKPDP